MPEKIKHFDIREKDSPTIYIRIDVAAGFYIGEKSSRGRRERYSPLLSHEELKNPIFKKKKKDGDMQKKPSTCVFARSCQEDSNAVLAKKLGDSKKEKGKTRTSQFFRRKLAESAELLKNGHVGRAMDLLGTAGYKKV